MISGSMDFSKEMLDAKEELEKMGHAAMLPSDIHACLNDPDLKNFSDQDRDEGYEKTLRHCVEKNLLKDALDKVSESDAVLIFNKTKNNIEGYIGAAVLMEIGLAFHLGKKIYLFNEVDKNQRYSIEIGITQPVVISGDLSKIE